MNLSSLQSSSYAILLSACLYWFFSSRNFFFSAIKPSFSALSIWTDEKISFKRRTQSKTNHKSNYLRNPLMHYTLSHCYVFFLWAGSFSKPKKLGLQPAESASRRVFRMLGKKSAGQRPLSLTCTFYCNYLKRPFFLCFVSAGISPCMTASKFLSASFCASVRRSGTWTTRVT